MEKYATLLNLRTLLHSMEHDLGLDDLSQAELDVFLVAQSMTRTMDDVVTSSDIRNHDLVLVECEVHPGACSNIYSHCAFIILSER
mgnify:CR=1 FL=1